MNTITVDIPAYKRDDRNEFTETGVDHARRTVDWFLNGTRIQRRDEEVQVSVWNYFQV